MQPVAVTHFSDVLCIWAYVSQIRYDELVARFPEQVVIDWRTFHVFGDVGEKIVGGWSDRGGVAAYAAHVQEVASRFPHVDVHPGVWIRTTPASSLPAHLLLCALRRLEGTGEVPDGTVARSAWHLRRAFFARCADLGRQAVLAELIEELELPAAPIEQALATGAAHAQLASDHEAARAHGVRASPTVVLNAGRQQLTGNVGYRVLEANVRELLESSELKQSWC